MKDRFTVRCGVWMTYRLEVRFKAYCRGWVMALYLSKLMTQRLTILAVQHITSMDTQKSQNLRPNLHPPAERNITTLTPRNHRTSAQTSIYLQRNMATLTSRNNRTSAQTSIHLQRETSNFNIQKPKPPSTCRETWQL